MLMACKFKLQRRAKCEWRGLGPWSSHPCLVANFITRPWFYIILRDPPTPTPSLKPKPLSNSPPFTLTLSQISKPNTHHVCYCTHAHPCPSISTMQCATFKWIVLVHHKMSQLLSRLSYILDCNWLSVTFIYLFIYFHCLQFTSEQL